LRPRIKYRGRFSVSVQNLSKIKYLSESILKKAFEGKLVPQDPNDLPAGELLKQIKIKKDKMSKNGK
jgi:type I restriction enzyme S subunit